MTLDNEKNVIEKNFIEKKVIKILGIESSAKTASAAICEIAVCDGYNDFKIISAGSVNTAVTHSETLLPLAENLLDAARLKFTDIDCFAVSNGPGSFTGLRIAVSAVKGMAYALGKPVYAVSALFALAYNLIGFSGIICSVMDARCGQVYNAIFKAEGNKIIRITADRAISLDELEKELLQLYPNENVILTGDGVYLAEKSFKSVCIAPPLLVCQNAASVCFSAFCENTESFQLKAKSIMPFYLRMPQAERERLKKL